MVKDLKVCILTTKEKIVEKLSARLMCTIKIDDEGNMWFFTKESSYKIDKIEEN